MTIKFIIFLLVSTLIYANKVEIVKGLPFVTVEIDGKMFKIERNQVKDSYLTNTFALTSRPSPPFFIEPFSVSEGIETYGELEVLDFISKKKGLFIDARLSNWYKRSAIPSALNIPFKHFLYESDEQIKVFKKLGGVLNKSQDEWNFKHVKMLLFYCNGAWCGQSPTAINALLENGYPKEKLKYYRGGMQSWQLLGLTTIVPKEKK